jgi:hypothetical protein
VIGVLLVGGFAAIGLGILFFGPTETSAFPLASIRLAAGLPTDNIIPLLFSERLAAGESTHGLLGDWNGSDRPPLQSGLLMIAGTIAEPFSGWRSAAFGASVAALSAWIPALWSLARTAGASRGASAVAVAGTGVLGSTIVNSMYTWPKLLSAALVLASAAILVHARTSTRRLPIGFAAAGAVFGLALLAHGAAAFAVPIVVGIGLLALRPARWRARIVASGSAVTAVVLVELPWLAYQRFVDPPGDRLLKWHLAGVPDPADPRSAWEAIADAYAGIDPAAWLAGRLANLGVAFDPRIFDHLGCFCGDDLAARRSAEFLLTSTALGLAAVALLVIAGVVVGRLLTRRADAVDARFLVAVATSLAAIVGWCLLIWEPGTAVVHQGSHAWMLLLAAAPWLWLTERWWWAALPAVAAQGVLTGLVMLPGDGTTVGGTVVLAVGGLAVVGALGLVRHDPRPTTA